MRVQDGCGKRKNKNAPENEKCKCPRLGRGERQKLEASARECWMLVESNKKLDENWENNVLGDAALCEPEV